MPSDYEDYESSSYNLDDVCERLDRIEETLKDTRSGLAGIEETLKNTRSGLAGLVWTALFLIALFVWIPDLWHSKARYAWSYDVSTEQVTANKRPKDCDFFHAPIGDKACEYKRQVSTVQVRTEYPDAAKPIHYVSYDDGKKWNIDGSVPPTQPQVLISWEKVDQ